MKQAVLRLQKHMKQKKIDYCLLYNFHAQQFNENFVHISGFDGLGVFVVPKSGSAYLIVPRMEYLRARKCGVKVVESDDIFAMCKKKLGQRKLRVGIDKSSVTLKSYARLRKLLGAGKSFVDVSDTLSSLRMVKSVEEIKMIRRACALTDEIYRKTFAVFSSFRTEADVAAFMTSLANSKGLQVAFKPIVASGVHSSEAHFEVSDTVLKKGFCVIDFGVRFRGYVSDMTRTVFIGSPSKADLELYKKVHDVQASCVKMVKPGVACSVLDKHARSVLGKDFCHSLGHGIGVGVHERPAVSFKSKHVLAVGNVITIEPGVYLRNKYGIRIEDDVLVTSKGHEVLTKTPRHLLVVKKN